MSRALMQLVQGGQCLLQQAAQAGLAVMEWQVQYGMLAAVGSLSSSSGLASSFTWPTDTTNATVLAAIRADARSHAPSGRFLLMHLHTGHLQLAALQHAAMQAGRAVAQREQGAAAAAAAAAAGHDTPTAVLKTSADRSAAAQPPTCKPGWCPIHSSGPAPAALLAAEATPPAHVYRRIAVISSQMKSSVGAPLWLSRCGHIGCRNLGGPSDAGMVTGCRGVVCGGCGVARFCSPDCASKAWPAHSKACGRLAAALGRTGARSSSNIGSHRTTNSSTSRAAKPGTEAAGPGGGRRGAATGQGAASSSNSSSSSRDNAAVRDQGAGTQPPCAAAGRVCAWCGRAGKELLRCGRCKAAWYCGVDHQRAAWKAGHKQECGAAAAAQHAADNS
jgi:hypothetical protein